MNVDTDVGDDDLTSPRSSDASGSTSPYRRRFNKQTRREALEQRFGRLRGRGGGKSLRQSLKGGSSKDEDDRSSLMANARTLGASSATSDDNHSFTGSVSSDSNDSHHLNDNNDHADYSLDGNGLNEADQAANGGRTTFIESRYHFIPIPKSMMQDLNHEGIPKSIGQEVVLKTVKQEVIPKSINKKGGAVSNGRPQQLWAKPRSVVGSSLPNFPTAPESNNKNDMAEETNEKMNAQPQSQVTGRNAPNTTDIDPENNAPKTERNKTSFVMQRAQELSKLSNPNPDVGQKQKQDGPVLPSPSKLPNLPSPSKLPNLPSPSKLPNSPSPSKLPNSPSPSKLPKFPFPAPAENRKNVPESPVETKLAHLRNQVTARYEASPVESPTENKAQKIARNENSIVMQRAQAFAKLPSSQQDIAHDREKVLKQEDSLFAPFAENGPTIPEVTDNEDHAITSPRGTVAQRALEFENLAKKIPEPPFRKTDGTLNRDCGVVSPDQENEKKQNEKTETVAKAVPMPPATASVPQNNRAMAEDSAGSSSEKARFHDASDSHALKKVEEYCAVKAMLRPVNRLPRTENTPVRPEDPRQTIYYRIVYKGVVALLSEPSTSASRSGAYVSYGEYITSRYEVDVDDGESTAYDPSESPRAASKRLDFKVRSPGGYYDAGQYASPESPPRSVLSQASASISSLETSRRATMKAVRVDEVLTGGYAVDAVPLVLEQAAETPRRSNTQFGPILGPSPLPIPDSRSNSSQNDAGLAELSDENTHMGVRHHGFLFTYRRDLSIAEEVTNPPVCEKGRFLYKVISSTPLPILTGPCSDAPKTKAMLLPGTMHEVCLTLTHDQQENQICFLRLSHRKGWIPDRKASPGGPLKLLMIPVENGDSHEDGSVISNSVASQSTASAKRHRLPRRRQDAENTSFETVSAPGTPARIPVVPSETPRRTVSHVPEQNTPNTSSNLSMLSDDSSMDHASSHRIAAGVVSPDRSVARSSASTSSSSMIYLMRVTAPQGLKILDAPQFQVNNLIHGKQEGPVASSGLHGRDSKSVSYMKTNQSVFQTLAGTKGSKGSPAVFDSISKSRKLPRNVYFEASSRMECFEAFNQGLGLIKLADGSGWAIVPQQEELDEQYRKFHGIIAGIKEGEATRAFEEVGNAIVEYPENKCVWLRVLPKTGLPVSCPPPPPLSHESGGSPTASSVGETSSVGGGSNFGLLRDSEVASAVGNVILDAMFRTPKKKEGESASVDNPGPIAPPKIIVAGHEDAVLPCGLCVEVDRWKDSADPSDSDGISQDFVRLRAGQGWIPRNMKGKPVVAPVEKPELRVGSFWFRVKLQQGMKVRLGPSHRAKSIRSDDGVYFRFECGEFLRASEIITYFEEDKPSECFAKLYRNRHAQLNQIQHEYKELAQLTFQSEWVQVHGDDRLFLEECAAAPKIERHRQGWRYNVVLNFEVMVRRGPSFAAESTGKILLGGESVLISERVTAPGETMTWLRLKDGGGWVHDFGPLGDVVMIAHSLRDRAPTTSNNPAAPAAQNDEQRGTDIPYNAIIARLFHGEGQDESSVGLHRSTLSK